MTHPKVQQVADSEIRGDLKLLELIFRQIDFSHHTFGPGPRKKGLIEHIRRELKELEAAPAQTVEERYEWVDLVILALDGLWRSCVTRSGFDDEAVATSVSYAIQSKIRKNARREWPEPKSQDEPVEHIKPPSEAKSDSGGVEHIKTEPATGSRQQAQDTIEKTVDLLSPHVPDVRLVNNKGERTLEDVHYLAQAMAGLNLAPGAGERLRWVMAYLEDDDGAGGNLIATLKSEMAHKFGPGPTQSIVHEHEDLDVNCLRQAVDRANENGCWVTCDPMLLDTLLRRLDK